MAPLLADVVQVDVPPHARGRGASTPSTARTGWPTSSSHCSGGSFPGGSPLVVEEAHWADGASVALLGRLAFARPATVGRAGGAPGRHGRLRAGSGVRVEIGPSAPTSSRRLRHRRHRSHTAPTSRGRRHRRAGRGQPALRRGGHPPGTRLGVPCPAARVSARGDEHPDRRAAACGAPHPALLRRPGPRLPAGGAAANPRGRRPRREHADPVRAGGVHRVGRRWAAPIPQQPGP